MRSKYPGAVQKSLIATSSVAHWRDERLACGAQTGDLKLRIVLLRSLGEANGLVKVALVTCLSVFQCSFGTVLEREKIMQTPLE